MTATFDTCGLFRQKTASAAKFRAPERISARETDKGDWARLIDAVGAQHDRAAFALLFQFFFPRVKATMIRMGLSSAASEELAQETLFIVWRKAHLFDATRGTASSWISAIAKNLRIDLARRELRPARRAGFDVDAEVCPHDQPYPEFHVSLAQAQRYVLTALATLPESQARLIELSFYREMAHAEIARALRIPLGTVKSRLRSALVHLRWSLDGLA